MSRAPGRPRKYENDADRAAARKEQNRQAAAKRRSRVTAAAVDFPVDSVFDENTHHDLYQSVPDNVGIAAANLNIPTAINQEDSQHSFNNDISPASEPIKSIDYLTPRSVSHRPTHRDVQSPDRCSNNDDALPHEASLEESAGSDSDSFITDMREKNHQSGLDRILSEDNITVATGGCMKGGIYINPESAVADVNYPDPHNVIADVNDGNITIGQSLASDTHMDRDCQWETGSINNFASPRFIQTPMAVLDATDSGDDHAVDRGVFGDGYIDAHYQDDASSSMEDSMNETAFRLAEQLTQFLGCCQDCHQDQSEVHDQAELEIDGEHWDLSTYNAHMDSLPDLLHNKGFLDSHDLLDEARAEETYCGPDDEPPVICLAHERTKSRKPIISFDIDSVIGFPSSLAVARQGLKLFLTPKSNTDLGNVRVGLKVQYLDDDGNLRGRHNTPVHKIPNYCIGRLCGFEDLMLYVLFPRMYQDKRPTSNLRECDIQRWIDDILLPAIYSQLESSQVQHLPSSHQHSKNLSLGRGIQSRVRGVGDNPRQQMLHYFLKADILADIWERVLVTVQSSKYGLFQGLQLFLSGKNLKTSSSAITISQARAKFEQLWMASVDPSWLDGSMTWYDIGKEICAPDSQLIGQWLRHTQEPQVYLWKRCCLDSYYHSLLYGEKAGKARRAVYTTAMLFQTACMTVLTSPASQNRTNGLVYSQFYSSTKEMFDCSKSYPFDAANLESIALDPDMFKAWQITAHSHNYDMRTLLKAYHFSKAACGTALVDSSRKSFGIREEHRVSVNLLDDVFECLALTNQLDIPAQAPRKNTRPYWIVSSKVFLQFLKTNINKFVLGFETTYCLSDRRLVSWEHTKIMIMFLRLLRCSYTSVILEKETPLWIDIKKVGVSIEKEEEIHEIREGMGLNVTLSHYGYAWLLPKVDWKNWVLSLDHTDNISFGNLAMLLAYQRRRGAVMSFHDRYQRVQMVAHWLDKYGGNDDARECLMWYLTLLCQEQYRVDVWRLFEKDIRKKYRKRCLSGSEPLCYNTISRFIKHRFGDTYIACGNRMSVKTARQLAKFTWDFNDGQQRNQWDRYAFRTLYRKCVHLIYWKLGKQIGQQWEQVHLNVWAHINWMVPLPTKDAFRTRNSDGQWRWVGIYRKGTLDIASGQKVNLELIHVDKWLLSRDYFHLIEGILDIEKFEEGSLSLTVQEIQTSLECLVTGGLQ